MQRPTGIGTRLALIVLGAVLFALALPALLASAQERVIKTTGPVVSLSCDPCHATIADNKIPNIKFSHASHILYECSACHTKFPHQPEGTTIPTMKDCWNCHGLRHGPQGVLASGDCGIKCHTTDAKRRPKFHVADWKNKPHVQPGEQQLQTTCMRCHDQKFCEDCHLQQKIFWIPAKPYVYDPGYGCMACHGGELPRLKGPINMIDASAHRDTRCIDCHPDFKYKDGKDATPIWRVNAGLACQSCHLTKKQTADQLASVKAYAGSIHAKRIAEKDYKSATCASCHGGHDIERLSTPAAKRRIRLAGQKMCASSGCHESAWDSYNDYWHGAAYKEGSLDAPACWDCHDGKHGTLQVKDPKSQASPELLGTTCSGGGLVGADGKALACHQGSDADFAAAGRSLIHGQVKIRQDNPVRTFFATVFGGQ